MPGCTVSSEVDSLSEHTQDNCAIVCKFEHDATFMLAS